MNHKSIWGRVPNMNVATSPAIAEFDSWHLYVTRVEDRARGNTDKYDEPVERELGVKRATARGELAGGKR